LINNSLIYLIVRLGNGLLAIATLAILSRMLSPSGYGIYSLFMAAGGVLSSILFQWLEYAIARFYPRFQDNPNDFLMVINRVFWLLTALAAICCIAIFFMHEILKIEPLMILIQFFLIVGLGIYTLTLQVNNSQNLPTQYGVISWSKSFITLLGSVILISIGMAEKGALLAFVVGVMVSALVINSRKIIGSPFKHAENKISIHMLKYGLPISLNVVANSIVDVVDRFLILKILGVAYVAPYSLTYDLVQLTIGPAMNVFMLSHFPRVVYMFEKKRHEDAINYLRKIGQNLLVFGLPLVVLLSLLANDICDVILDNQYKQVATSMMPWLAAAIFIGVYKSYFLDVSFQLMQATRYQGYIALIMAIINIILNLMLLPRYGVIAAAWSTLATFLVGAIASWFFGRKLFALPCLNDALAKSIFACCVMAFILLQMLPFEGLIWLLIKLIIGIAIYILVAILFNISGSRILIKPILDRIRKIE
jgi:O-antigen/teichoic acid export membrane protein